MTLPGSLLQILIILRKILSLIHRLISYQGIYETKVPLDFNAVVELGCVCRVDRNARHRNAQDGWNLSELHMKTTVECSYMELAIPFCYLYNRSGFYLYQIPIYFLGNLYLGQKRLAKDVISNYRYNLRGIRERQISDG